MLAAFLGMAQQTIYNRHSARGDLPPAIKVGRLLRFRSSDVEAWLERQQQTGVACAPLPPQRKAPAERPGRPTKAEQVAARRLR